MAGLDPDDPKYIVARGLKAVEDFKAREAAEDAAAIIRAEQEAMAAQLAEQAAAILRAEQEAAEANKQPTMANVLADELRKIYPGGRPAGKRVKVIDAELRERGVETFGRRTLETALAEAWKQ